MFPRTLLSIEMRAIPKPLPHIRSAVYLSSLYTLGLGGRCVTESEWALHGDVGCQNKLCLMSSSMTFPLHGVSEKSAIWLLMETGHQSLPHAYTHARSKIVYGRQTQQTCPNPGCKKKGNDYAREGKGRLAWKKVVKIRYTQSIPPCMRVLRWPDKKRGECRLFDSSLEEYTSVSQNRLVIPKFVVSHLIIVYKYSVSRWVAMSLPLHEGPFEVRSYISKTYTSLTYDCMTL